MPSKIIYTSDKVFPYVYKGIHKVTNEYYIGYREANKLPSHLDLPKYKTSSKKVKPIFDEFDWYIIAEFFDGNSAYDFEQKLISESWADPLLLNQHYAHSGNRFKLRSHTNKTKQKISKSKTGINFTQKHKQNIGLSGRGKAGYWKNKSFSDVHIQNLKNSHSGMSGLNHSIETKQKISDSHKGIKHSDKTKLQLSIKFTGEGNPNFGKNRTNESKEKSRQSNTIIANLRKEFSILSGMPYRKVTKKLPEFIKFLEDRMQEILLS